MSNHPNRIPECVVRLEEAGISWQDAYALRRIAMTLHRWHELECGSEYGAIEREGDDGEGRPYWLNAMDPAESRKHKCYLPDRERGALKRLAKIMGEYPTLKAYVQGDPRGASLYILRPGDVRDGLDVEACYSNGIAVYK